MKQISIKVFNIFIACFSTFLITISIFIIVLMRDYHNERERYHYIASNEIETIITTIDCVMARIYTLNAMVIDNNGRTDFFDKMAKELYNAVKEETGVALKNIALAPEGIVEKVYPLTGNESLIGFNFMDSSMPGNLEAIDAYKNGRTILTNPFSLIQGGTGMAGRAPVIMDIGDSELLWGLVTVTMDYDNLLSTLNLDNLKKMGMAYRLSFIDNGETKVMAEDGKMDKKPVTLKFNVRNLNWEFSLMPDSRWITVDRYIPSCILIAFAIWLVGMYANIYHNLKKSNEKLKHLSFTDGLTGVYSRNYVNSMLIDVKDGKWKDPQFKYSLMIVDIDNFKHFNDDFGHDIGDKVVAFVAEVLKNVINENNGDCVIRFGGDEFIVLFNKVDRKKMDSIREKIKKGMYEISLEYFFTVEITVSGGIALYDECKNRSYKSMMITADKKLYEAKEKGKNRIEM